MSDNQKQLQTSGPESSAELSPRDLESQAERRAQAKAAKIAKSNKKNSKKTKKDKTPPKHGLINKKQRDDSYKRTLTRVQSELPPSDRLFSKIIHFKFIEKTSDIIAGTIARPNAMLFGAVFAFILTLITYTVSKTIGYSLSGSETIVSYIIGWIIGLTIDYFHVLMTGKKD